MSTLKKYRGGKDLKCKECGKVFHCYPYELKQGRKFCSQSCYYEWQKGQPKPKPENFSETMRKVNPPAGKKLHKKDNGSYVLLYRPEHPNARQSSPDYGYVFEHVMVVSNSIGRMIEKGEVIHHLNGKKDDNIVENLVLCKTSREHNAIHDRMEKFVEKLIRTGKVYYDRTDGQFKFTE